MALITANIRREGDVTIVDLTGRLTLGEEVAFGPGSGTLLGAVVRKLVEQGQKKIVLNLAGVTYVDSSGLGQLVSAYTTAHKSGGEVKLLNPTAPVRELLENTRLHTIMDVKDEEAAAIKALSASATGGN